MPQKAMDNAYVLWGFEVGATVTAEDGKCIMAVMLKAGSWDWGCALRDVLLTILFCTATGKFWR